MMEEYILKKKNVLFCEFTNQPSLIFKKIKGNSEAAITCMPIDQNGLDHTKELH
jgi:hypothetical protein